MALLIDQLFCPNMRGLLNSKDPIAGGRGIDSRQAQIFYYNFGTGQLYLSAVFYPLPYVKIGLREGRGIESRRAQIFLLFWDSTGQLYMSGSDCGRVAGSIPEELRFFIILYCTGQLYLSALRARKIYIRYPPY